MRDFELEILVLSPPFWGAEVPNNEAKKLHRTDVYLICAVITVTKATLKLLRGADFMDEVSQDFLAVCDLRTQCGTVLDVVVQESPH